MQVNFGRREHIVARFLKKNQNAPRPSGHPPVRGFFGLPYASRLHCRFFYRFGAVVVICNCPDTPYIFVTSCPMVSNHVEVEGGSMRVPGTVPLQQPNRVFWLLWVTTGMVLGIFCTRYGRSHTRPTLSVRVCRRRRRVRIGSSADPHSSSLPF